MNFQSVLLTLLSRDIPLLAFGLILFFIFMDDKRKA